MTTALLATATGALAGALKAMYSSIATRAGEIATLRALDFARALGGAAPALRAARAGVVDGLRG